MRIILTNHARIRANERGITFEEISETILHPDYVTQQDKEIFIFKKLKNQYLYLVYSKDENGDWVIITVLKTSKIENLKANKEKFVAIEFWEKVYALDKDEQAKEILAEFYYSEGNFQRQAHHNGYAQSRSGRAVLHPYYPYAGRCDYR